METVQNVANAASKMIWGENNTQANETAGQEPISGSQGKGSAEEPFDQGNAENPTSTSNPKMSESNTSSSIPNNPNNAATGGGVNPLKDTDKTGVTGNTPSDPQNTGGNPSDSASNPGAAPSSGGAPFQKQQGADKPSAAPSGEHEGAVKESKDDAEDILKKRDPNDHSGEPMKMHDGSEEVPKTQEERRNSKSGNPGGQEHGKEEKGTGEQYVKSSGLAADGGDFDVTKPGAGREADRLLEEKGIHRTEKGAPAPEPSSSDNKEKVPLGEKIKSKLHIGHKDK